MKLKLNLAQIHLIKEAMEIYLKDKNVPELTKQVAQDILNKLNS